MPKRRLKHRELIKKLKDFSIIEDKNRGKGSERMLIINRGIGGKYSGPQYPIKCHGDDTEYNVKVVDSILRIFSINEDEFWK